MKTLKTERLILRKVKIDDYKTIYDTWTSDFEVSMYVSWYVHKSPRVTKKLVEYWCNEYKNDKKCYRWIVELKKSHTIIGMIDVVRKNLEYKTCEMGYVYGKKYWGNGYGTEALKAVINYLHNEGFVVITAGHMVENVGSGRVMEKAGMTYEATLHSRVIDKRNKREDVAIYYSQRG